MDCFGYRGNSCVVLRVVVIQRVLAYVIVIVLNQHKSFYLFQSIMWIFDYFTWCQKLVTDLRLQENGNV